MLGGPDMGRRTAPDPSARPTRSRPAILEWSSTVGAIANCALAVTMPVQKRERGVTGGKKAMKRRAKKEKTGREASTARRGIPSRSELQWEVTELAEQRAAISEVLRAIASSPHDLQPIFDTILVNADR